MKNIKNILAWIFTIIICFVLQIYIFNTITLLGVRANIIFTFCVVTTLKVKPNISIPITLVVGILSDILFTFTIGKYLIAYVVISILIISLTSLYNKESNLTTALIIFVSTILVEYIFSIYNLVQVNEITNIFSIALVGVKGAIINLVIGLVLNKILSALTREDK